MQRPYWLGVCSVLRTFQKKGRVERGVATEKRGQVQTGTGEGGGGSQGNKCGTPV